MNSGSGRKGSVLIVCVWGLVFLTLLCISFAFQASQALRVSGASLDEIRSYAAAQAAIGVARLCLVQDGRQSSEDHRGEIWAENEAFQKIEVDKDNGATAVIFNESDNVLSNGMTDEDGKININKAHGSLIKRFLKEYGLTELQSAIAAKDILIWRGTEVLDKETEIYYKTELGYECKRSNFSVIDEISLVKEFCDADEHLLNAVKEGFTTLGGDKVNINTASERVLRGLFKAAYDEYLNGTGKLDITETDADNVTTAIVNYRHGGQYFKTGDMELPMIAAKLGLGSASGDSRTRLIQQVLSLGWIKADSDYFKIQARGVAGNAKKDIVVYYQRSQDKLLWRA